MKFSKCHPDRAHVAKGLCLSCYRKDYEERNAEKIRERKKLQYSRNTPVVKQRSDARYTEKRAEICAQRKARYLADPSIGARRKPRGYGLSLEEFERMASDVRGAA